MDILLTGASGFIGTNLHQFLKHRYNITCLDRNTGDDLLTCDLPEVDVVIHLAGLSGVRDSLKNPEDYWKQNVIVSQRLFDKYSDKKIYYASSSTAAEPWRNPYAMSKYGMEQIAPGKAMGMRFTTVYGPGARDNMLIPRILRNDVPYVNTNHSRDFIHVDDLCSAIHTLLIKEDKWFGVIDIGHGISNKLVDVLKYFEIDTKQQLGDEHERLDNLADISYLTELGWKPKACLKDYVSKYRRTN